MVEPLYDSQQAVCERLHVSASTLMRRLAEFPFPREMGKPNGRWGVTETALLLWRDWWVYQLSLPLPARTPFRAWLAAYRPEHLWRLRPPEPPEVAGIVGRTVSSGQEPLKSRSRAGHKPARDSHP